MRTFVLVIFWLQIAGLLIYVWELDEKWPRQKTQRLSTHVIGLLSALGISIWCAALLWL